MRPGICWPVLATLVAAAVAFAATPLPPEPGPMAGAPPVLSAHGASPHGKMPPAGPAHGGSPQPAMPAPPKVAWETFPQADTAEAFATGRTPFSSDTTVELVLDDGGVNFGADGVMAMSSTKVYLAKSRPGADDLKQLPGVPRMVGARVTSFVLHDNGTRVGGKISPTGKVTFDQVFPGDLVYVSTQVALPSYRQGARNAASTPTLLRGAFPVRKVRFWVRYPAGKPAGTRGLGLPEPVTRADGAFVVREWRAENLARLPAEDGAVAPLEGAPVVLLDSDPDPDWLAGVCRGYLRQPAGPRLKKLAAKIRAQYPTQGAQLEAARDYAAHKVAPLDREITWPDTLKRITAEGVLARGKAGSYGRLALLAGLLRELGMNPGVAMVDPQRLWRRPPAQAPDYVRCLLVAPWNKPMVWLNPSTVVGPANHVDMEVQGLTATLTGPTGAPQDVEVPVSPGESRGTAISMTGLVDSAGAIAGNIRVRYRGADADLQRAIMRPMSMRDASEVMQRIMSQALFNAEITDLNGEGFETSADTVTMVSNFRARDLVDASGELRWLRLPGRLVPELDRTPRTTARTLIRILGGHTQRMDFELPRGWALSGGADSASGGGVCFRWSELRGASDGRLHVERSVTVLKPEIQAADFDALLTEQDAMNKAFDRPVVFKLTH